MMRVLFITYFILISIFGFSTNMANENQAILTKVEESDLKLLREEEKLARDVYFYAYKKYELQIFEKISSSEQSHMDQILVLLTKYGIKDPALQNRGEFTDKKLQNLYNKLTRQVDISLIEALKVGATIEDLDIFDIQEFKKRTDNLALLKTYIKLECGSKNHIRAFVKQLSKQKASYIPQYISEKQFENIIKSSNKPCGNMNKEKGEKKGKRKGKGNRKGKGQGHGRGQGKGRNMSW